MGKLAPHQRGRNAEKNHHCDCTRYSIVKVLTFWRAPVVKKVIPVVMTADRVLVLVLATVAIALAYNNSTSIIYIS